MSGPDTIFSIKTGITTLVTNSIKILFFQLHPFRAEFWGYCALICSALRLMRAGWLTLVPPLLSPAGEQHGQGEMRQKIICYITRLFPPPGFCCPWNRNRTNYSSQKCIFLCSEKITFLKFPVRSSKGAEGGGVCPHVLMSPIVVWRAAECWLLSVAWLGAVRVYHNRMSQPLSDTTVNEPLRNCHI